MRFAWLRSVLLKLASVRSALERFASERKAPERSAPERSAPERSGLVEGLCSLHLRQFFKPCESTPRCDWSAITSPFMYGTSYSCNYWTVSAPSPLRKAELCAPTSRSCCLSRQRTDA